MSKQHFLTAKEYAAVVNKPHRTILYWCNHPHLLPDGVTVKKSGRDWVVILKHTNP